MWTQEEATFEGKYYQIKEAINQPKGVQMPHIPLLIGGSGEKVTLKLVAQYGDACNVDGSIEEIKHKFEVLQGHCATVGRDYASIRRTAIAMCAIAETDEQALAQMPPAILDRLGERVNEALIGSPATIRKRLKALEEAGIQELIINFANVLELEPLRIFAHEFFA
jgi:alkanesulfonate monooxygenase SsuD/methylene tetrahydromethanopterin reductase-like flavin-dependent oxidoreductase (luciferase family)